LSLPDDLAGQQFGKWARARAGVPPAEQTKPEPTPEEARAQAGAGGADGGAGHQEQILERNPSDLIREAVAIKRMGKRF
jgi:hypothetical protein